jgi:hypothetical protein
LVAAPCWIVFGVVAAVDARTANLRDTPGVAGDRGDAQSRLAL